MINFYHVMRKDDLTGENELFVQAPDVQTAIRLYVEHYEQDEYFVDDFRVFGCEQLRPAYPQDGPKAFAWGVDIIELT
jgi:hypothetical protein